MRDFTLTHADLQAIQLAMDTARRLLKHPTVTPLQVIAIGNALYALERLPLPTIGSSSNFGLVYRAGTEDFREMKYIDFRISESAFEISNGGSVYDKEVGSDSFSTPGWSIEAGGYRNEECELYSLQDAVDQYWNLGAEISASDDSDIEYEDSE
jgi:hypothetical protein